MARCLWLICSGLFLFSAAVASESPSNGTASAAGNVTERDGRTYDVHPPAPGSVNERLEVQSLSPRPKSLGTGTWKAIKIWNEPVGVSSSSTTKRASSPERVVASSAWRVDCSHCLFITFLYPLLLCLTRLHNN